MSQIKYLIKFTSKQKFAQDLVDGIIFTNAVDYYALLHKRTNKLGMGDMKDGAISHTKQIQKNSDFLVFCTYSVYEKDIEDGTIKIPNKIMEDFECQNGYAVVIDFEKFIQDLPLLDTGGFNLRHKPITYRSLTFQDTRQMLTSKNNEHLFIKNPDLKHQQEYRILIEKHATKIIQEEMIDNQQCSVLIGYKGEPFSLHKSIDSYTKKIHLQNIKINSNYFYLKI